MAAPEPELPASLADALAVHIVLRTLGAAGLLARADQLAPAPPSPE